MNTKLLPKYLATFGSFLLLFLGFFHPITAFTQDLGRHLLTGQIIWQTHHVPTTNLFSYTYPNFPFINTHWLAEVLFYPIHQAFGMPGLFISMLLLASGAWLLVFKQAYVQASALSLAIGSFIYLHILFERTDLRPELFSFLFLAIFIVTLYRNREKPTKLIYLLIPLQLLWVNMHIYFAIGLVILGLFLLDAAWIHRKHLVAPALLHLSAVFVLACLASLLNPHGLTGMLYPLNVFHNYGYTIEENQTIFLLDSLGFHKTSVLFLKIGIVLLFISLGVNRKKTKPIDWLLALMFSYLATQAVRNLPLFVFATFIPFTISFSVLLQKTQTFLPPYSQFEKHGTAILSILIVVLVLWSTVSVTKGKVLGYGVEPGAGPAVDFLTQNHLPQPLYNNFDIGSYLEYRLYPAYRTFVDGRPEAYPASFFQDTYIPMQQDPTVFAKVDAKYRFQTIFFTHTDQTPWAEAFLKNILTNPNWKLIYLDDQALILVRNTPQNQALIKKFAMDATHLRIRKTESSLQADLRLASFLSKVGWITQGIPYYLDILRQQPDNCPAIGLLATAYAQQNNPAGSIYQNQYLQQCQQL